MAYMDYEKKIVFLLCGNLLLEQKLELKLWLNLRKDIFENSWLYEFMTNGAVSWKKFITCKSTVMTCSWCPTGGIYDEKSKIYKEKQMSNKYHEDEESEGVDDDFS